MTSNYNRKSNSSGSRSNPNARSRRGSSSSNSSPSSRRRPSGQIHTPSFSQPPNRSRQAYQPISSVRVGELEQAKREHRLQKSYRRYVIRIIVVLILLGILAVAAIVVYNSSLFTISNVSVSGVEHLTTEEMTELASVPQGTTLLRVDTEGIRSRLMGEPWVEGVTINRLFPDTLELVISEREVAAIVDVTVNNAKDTETWAMASGGLWLMAIPAYNSDEAKSVNPQIYEDLTSVLRITEVPYGIEPKIGTYCADDNVCNALAIIDGLSTELSSQVKTVSATGTETTTLILKNGIEIAFGTAESIRDKERVCLKLMEEYPNKIAYINVRVVDKPTWRAAD